MRIYFQMSYKQSSLDCVQDIKYQHFEQQKMFCSGINFVAEFPSFHVAAAGRSWQVVGERMTAWHSWHRPDTRPRPWRRSPRPRLASRTVSSLQVFTTTQSWSWEIRSHDRPDPGRLEGRGSPTTQLRWCNTADVSWLWWSAEDDDQLMRLKSLPISSVLAMPLIMMLASPFLRRRHWPRLLQ